MEEYKYILIPIIAILCAQILKTIIETVSTKKFSLERFFNGAGGMPSTHTTAVVSITTLMYIDYGITSELFATCLIFSFIVMYDAMGIRYETGKQAEVINILAKKANLKEGSVLFFIANKKEMVAAEFAGQIRNELGKKINLLD